MHYRDIEYSDLAKANLEAIAAYGREHYSQDQRQSYLDLLDDALMSLSTFPDMGRDRSQDIAKGIRSFPIGNEVIIYHYDSSVLYIDEVRPCAIPLPQN